MLVPFSRYALPARFRNLTAVAFLIVVCSAPRSERVWAASPVESLQDAVVKVAEQLKPSVVNIRSEQVRKRAPENFGDMFPNFPFDMVPPQTPPRAPGRKERGESLGTGIVVREDGYILTNNHVVKDATDVKVVFDAGSDQPEEVSAKIVATDAEVDIAILKIERKGLTPVELGDSAALKVGSFVVAIGSPFRFEHTVTFGVVSAKGRHLTDESMGLSLQDYIQTDASINRGNSGGPLVDINGKVVGINTAIYTPTGGNIGIGFAVPIDAVKRILPHLIKGEKIERGWLGIKFGALSKDKAEIWGITQGFEVSGFTDGSPAEKAGMQEGDILVEMDGQKLTSSEQLRAMVAGSDPGKKMKAKVLRIENDKVQEKDLEIILGERPSEGNTQESGKNPSLLGLSVQAATPENLKRWGLPENAKGVIVAEVDEEGPAADAEINRGELITTIIRDRNNIRTIRNVGDYNQALEGVKPGNKVLIRLQNREGDVRTAILTAREPGKEERRDEDKER